MRRGNVTLVGLLKAGAVVTVLSTAAAYAAVDHFALQLFAHFPLQYFAVSLLLALAFALLREHRFALAMLAATVVNGMAVVPWYNGGAQAAPAGDTALKVVLANVLSSNIEYEALLQFVSEEQPDVLFLLEISPAWQAELTRLDGEYAHSLVEPHNGNFGIAMYSKLPVASGAIIISEPRGFPSIVATLDAGRVSLDVVATHPMIPFGADNYAARNAQLRALGDLVQGSGGPRLLAGDLNSTMWDRHYRLLENRTRLRNVRDGRGILPTWPTFMPIAMIPIDHVLVSADIGVQDVRTGPDIGSDHLPLVVTITL